MRYSIWFLVFMGAAAVALFVLQSLKKSSSGPKMQTIPPIDFSTGSVDLILKEHREWLIRDQALVRQAAETSIPESSNSRVLKLIASFFSALGGSQYISLTFLRDGKELTSVKCLRSDWDGLPELKSLSGLLTAAGIQIKSMHASFTNYEAYLTAYARIEKSTNRYGSINPATPEKQHKLDRNLHITFPPLYKKTPDYDWLTSIRQAYDNAFRKEYAHAADQFNLTLTESQDDDMILRRCSDKLPVMSKDGTKALFPSGWKFGVIKGTLSATETMANQITARTDWSFLPEINNDKDALTRDIHALVNQSGDQTDPKDCYYFTESATDKPSVRYDEHPYYSYSIDWKQTLPKNASKEEQQAFERSPSRLKMKTIPPIDFSAGPVDLIVEDQGKEWLVRDQALVRQAVETGIPDTSGDETKLLFMSVLFMSPPGRSPPSVSLTFLRDGEKLASIECMQSLCGKLPELRDLFDLLIAAGMQIEPKYETFTDYDAYLTAYARIEKSTNRYGSIDPAVPEKRRKLDQKLYITSPLVYRKTSADDWLTSIQQAYDNAFRKEYAHVTDQFALIFTESQRGGGMILRRCSDNLPVMSKDGATALFPSDWKFGVIEGTLSATETMADQVEARTDWSFLPEIVNDNPALTRDIRALVNQSGDQTDPDDCYSVDFAPGTDELSVWRDYPYTYSIGWKQTLPENAP